MDITCGQPWREGRYLFSDAVRVKILRMCVSGLACGRVSSPVAMLLFVFVCQALGLFVVVGAVDLVPSNGGKDHGASAAPVAHRRASTISFED